MPAAHLSAFAQEKRPSRGFPTPVIFVYFSCVLTVSILLGRTSPRIPEAAPCPPKPEPALGPQRLLPRLAKRLGPRWALPRAEKHHSGRDKTPRYQVEEGERSRNTKHRTSLRAFLRALLSSQLRAGRRGSSLRGSGCSSDVPSQPRCFPAGLCPLSRAQEMAPAPRPWPAWRCTCGPGAAAHGEIRPVPACPRPVP